MGDRITQGCSAVLVLIVPLWLMWALMLICAPAHAAQWQWHGLIIAEEERCSPYDRRDYRYPPYVEAQIVDRQAGLVYSPYDHTFFTSTTDTDIEHIVATSEAHDSGLCAMPIAVRRHFAMDLDNLTLASPELNRHQKQGKDVAEWLPPHNRCWYVRRVLHVKRKYGLTIDVAEHAALATVVRQCEAEGKL